MSWVQRVSGVRRAQRVRPAVVRRRVLRLAAALGAVVAVTLGSATSAAAAGPVIPLVPDPMSAFPLPALADGFSPYLPQVSCDPVTKPGTDAFRGLMLTTYGGRDLGVTRGCDVAGISEHEEGRAWDWGLDATVPAEKAVADQALAWLLAPGPDGVAALNARRLGVMYLIYNRRIWGAYRSAEGWRPYTGGESHSDHIHVSFSWAGARRSTSWWTGAAGPVDYGPCPGTDGSPAPVWTAPQLTPCPPPIDPMTLTGTPLLAQNATGGYVTQLQRLLAVTPVTGFFGPITATALTTFQTVHGLQPTATTTAETWAALRAAAAAAPPTTTTPVPGPVVQPVVAGRAFPASMRYRVRTGDSLTSIAARWHSTAAAITSVNKLTTDTIAVGRVLTVPVRSGLTRWTFTVLHKGSTGAAVKALQTALGMRLKHRTGMFGDITLRRVNAFKTSHGWVADGVVKRGVWRALGA